MDDSRTEVCVIREQPLRRAGFLGLFGPVIQARWVAEVITPQGSRTIGRSEPHAVQANNFSAEYTADQQLRALVETLQRDGWQPRGEGEGGKGQVMTRPHGR